jgi:hypothetical protein
MPSLHETAAMHAPHTPAWQHPAAGPYFAWQVASAPPLAIVHSMHVGAVAIPAQVPLLPPGS